MRLKVAQLSQGEVSSAGFKKEDRDELMRARRIIGDDGHLLTILREWKAAKTREHGFTPATTEDVVKAFIKEGSNLGKQHQTTYGSKLKSLCEKFPGRYLHTISTVEFAAYLGTYKNGVTHNDHRKKITSMMAWARRNGALPKKEELAIKDTQRATEKPAPIGIIPPRTYGILLLHIADNHPHYLPALVLAGFAGVRSDEIHGKRKAPTKSKLKGRVTEGKVCQKWEDINLDHESPYVRVTVAKTNTPASRKSPLCKAAIEWLILTPKRTRKGYICGNYALDRVRKIGKTLGLDLPPNCFRHSYISYAVERTGEKARIATFAGTSERKIDTNYRALVDSSHAELWNNLTPEYCRRELVGAVETISEN